MIRGLDVSHYQGDVNWAALKTRYGLSFGAAKCTEGMTFTDSYYAQNRARIRAAGLKAIAYHYAAPSQSSGLRRLARRLAGRPLTTVQSSARAQATRFVARAGDVDALCLDLEKSSLSQTDTNAWMREFGDALHDLAPGVVTIAYLGGYAANGSGQNAVDHFDRWWYPRYASMSPATSWPLLYTVNVASPNTTGWPHPPYPHIWQWSPNVGGMDANVSDLTVTELFDNGGNVPTAAEIADELLSRQLPNPIAGPGDPPTVSFQTHLVWANAHATRAVETAAAALALLQHPDGLAAAIVAALPPNPGTPTAAEIADAVAAKFSTLLGGTP
jgi:hypothetical protein